MDVIDTGRGRAKLRPVSGLSLAGKGGDSEARAQMGNLHRGERVGVDTAAGAFPLHALSYLILGDEMSPMAPPAGDPSSRSWSGLLPTEMAWVGLSSRGRRCRCLKSFFAHLVCCQDSKTHVMRQSDLQPLVIPSCCVSFIQKLERDG